ncbi:MAG: hypothetical protein J6A28_00925 [Clostridia bacterium]|nr:hypothetical protein [Clostridia bacterium]
MNIIEKRKGQLKGFGIILLFIGVAALVGGILMIALGSSNPWMIIGGIIVGVLGLAGVIVGIIFTWVSSAVKATHGSIAEENLAIGTVNIHKCENCGAQVEEGVQICKKCEENLKP